VCGWTARGTPQFERRKWVKNQKSKVRPLNSRRLVGKNHKQNAPNCQSKGEKKGKKTPGKGVKKVNRVPAGKRGEITPNAQKNFPKNCYFG